jgi:hypothetical protein
MKQVARRASLQYIPEHRSVQVVYSNAFLKTTVRNNVSVLESIVHYLLPVSAPIGGHLQVKCTQNIYLR